MFVELGESAYLDHRNGERESEYEHTQHQAGHGLVVYHLAVYCRHPLQICEKQLEILVHCPIELTTQI